MSATTHVLTVSGVPPRIRLLPDLRMFRACGPQAIARTCIVLL